MAKVPKQESQSNRLFGLWLAGLIFLQIIAGLWHIGDPFIDGRYHYNWGPPFWLMHAEDINEIGLNATYWGLNDYAAHPQLIALVIAPWTAAFGYSETSIRTLALFLTVLATFLLTMAIRSFLDNRQALAFAAIFAALPAIYMFGRMLNQEILLLVFLGMYLWGAGLLNQDKLWGLWLVAVGSAGMMLSDWSGAVFTFVIGIAAFILWGREGQWRRAIQFMLASWGSAGLGLLLYVWQSYAQAGMPPVKDFINEYVELWRYRAGQKDTAFSWLGWLRKQRDFATINFGSLFVLAGVAGLVYPLFRRGTELATATRAAWFGVAVTVAAVAYLLVVPQASAIHVYYQYYLSVPIALGLVLGCASLAEQTGTLRRATFVTLILVVWASCAGLAFYQFNHLLTVDTWGNKTDIELIKLVKKIPASQTVVAINTLPSALDWFSNPNIKYYAGREIKGEVLETEVPQADWLIFPNVVLQDLVAVVDVTPGYGALVDIQTQCADHLCLAHIVKK